jgi:nucleoside-diphosphate-sugar epimerase/quercetin dioxygenase-like cupin family protein
MVRFLASLLGHVRGGLSYVLVGGMYLVSGISGSKAADMAAIAPVLFPEMRKRGVDEGEMVALLAATGAQTETIPPSIALITIGSVTGISIAALFSGGLVPALVLAVLLCFVVWWRNRKANIAGGKRDGHGVGADPVRVLRTAGPGDDAAARRHGRLHGRVHPGLRHPGQRARRHPGHRRLRTAAVPYRQAVRHQRCPLLDGGGAGDGHRTVRAPVRGRVLRGLRHQPGEPEPRHEADPRLVELGWQVRGLVRSPQRAALLEQRGIQPVLGGLDDADLLRREAAAADAAINTASADHAAAVHALLQGVEGSGKPFIHTSGSSVVGDDARGGPGRGNVIDEDTPFVVAPLKQPRRDIDLAVLGAAERGVRSAVICPSNIYGLGRGLSRDSARFPPWPRMRASQGVVQIVGEGLNVWANAHIDDVVELYVLALDKAPAGALYFAENGEASFGEIGAAIAKRLGLRIESLPPEVAAERWGEAKAYFSLGSNSRVRALRGRRELGWTPRHASVIDWILKHRPRIRRPRHSRQCHLSRHDRDAHARWTSRRQAERHRRCDTVEAYRNDPRVGRGLPVPRLGTLRLRHRCHHGRQRRHAYPLTAAVRASFHRALPIVRTSMSQHVHFLPFASLPEVPRGKGIVNYLIASKKVGALAMHTGISKLPVGIPVPRHSHSSEEQVTVLEGRVRIRLGGQEQICERFDSTFISPGVEHELVNVGDDTAYVLVVYGSPDVNRTFAATGETVGIGSEGDTFKE